MATNMAASTLTVLKFDTPDGAQQMSDLLQQLQKQQLITVMDAAIVTWKNGAKKPKTQQLHGLAGIGALDGAFWGLLFGLLFFIPLFGLAIGAAMGALMGSMSDVGIDDKFINEVRNEVTPGTSALFLMTTGAVLDKLVDAVHQSGLPFKLIASNLSREDEQLLTDIFAQTEDVAAAAAPVASAEAAAPADGAAPADSAAPAAAAATN